MVSYLLLIILFLLAIIIGCICTLGGIGGGVFTIPFFTLILGFDSDVSKATTLFLVLLSSAMATFSFHKKKQVHFPSTLVMGGCSIVGSLLASIVLTQFPIERNLFLIIFGIFEIAIAVQIGFKIYRILRERKQERQISTFSEEEKTRDISAESFDSLNLDILKDKKKLIKSISFFIFGGFGNATSTGNVASYSVIQT